MWQIEKALESNKSSNEVFEILCEERTRWLAEILMASIEAPFAKVKEQLEVTQGALAGVAIRVFDA